MRYRGLRLLIALLTGILAASCGSQADTDVSTLRATISVQETQITELMPEEQPSSVAEPPSEPEPTSEPEIELEQGLKDQVIVQLANEGMYEDMYAGERLLLVYAVENESDLPVSVSLEVRFYDESGAMLDRVQMSQCDSTWYDGLPYTPPHTVSWIAVRAPEDMGGASSHRLVDYEAQSGCITARSHAYELYQYGSKPPETIYDSVDLVSAEVSRKPGEAWIDGLLENTGPGDTSTVYVQAVGFDSSGAPILPRTVLHWTEIPPGERMPLSETLFWEDIVAPVAPVIGEYSDIASWEFVVAGLTPAR